MGVFFCFLIKGEKISRLSPEPRFLPISKDVRGFFFHVLKITQPPKHPYLGILWRKGVSDITSFVRFSFFGSSNLTHCHTGGKIFQIAGQTLFFKYYIIFKQSKTLSTFPPPLKISRSVCGSQ